MNKSNKLNFSLFLFLMISAVITGIISFFMSLSFIYIAGLFTAIIAVALIMDLILDNLDIFS